MFQELVKLELSTRLVVVRTDGPDVTGINKKRTSYFPEQMCAIFHVEVQLHVSRLVDEVDTSVLADIRTRTKSANTPSAHAIGSTREISFFKRQDSTVSIGISNSKSGMEYELVVVVQLYVTCEVNIPLYVLCIGNIKESVLSLCVFMEIQRMCCAMKQIACCFCIGFDGNTSVVVGITHTYFHNEKVLVIIAQDGILAFGIVKILITKRFTYPWHGDIVEIKQVYAITVMMPTVIPFVFPCYRKDSSMELRSVLKVV